MDLQTRGGTSTLPLAVLCNLFCCRPTRDINRRSRPGCLTGGLVSTIDMAHLSNGLPQPLSGHFAAKKLTSVIWYSDLDGGFGERPFSFAAFLAAFDLHSLRLLAGFSVSTALGVPLTRPSVTWSAGNPHRRLIRFPDPLVSRNTAPHSATQESPWTLRGPVPPLLHLGRNKLVKWPSQVSEQNPGSSSLSREVTPPDKCPESKSLSGKSALISASSMPTLASSGVNAPQDLVSDRETPLSPPDAHCRWVTARGSRQRHWSKRRPM